ncbi:DUF106 domain-containing protein [Methanosarcinaceae archaeon]|nr:DUF106 domain-containing protein [Methanosarcinaceae archaeon]
METAQAKSYLEKILLAIGVLLFIGVLIPGFREILGQTVNIFMGPVAAYAGPSNFFLVISVMAVITACYSSLIQKYTIDQERMMEMQENMKRFQAEMREAQKTQNTYQMKRLQEQQAEMMGEQSAMMKEQFKPMFYIVIVSIPLYMWMYYYVNTHAGVTIVFPFWGERPMMDLVGIWIFRFPICVIWWIITSIAFSQILRKILKIGVPGV